INLPVFPFRTPEAFYEQMLASKPDPNTGKPDADKMKAFLEHHPETVQALKIAKSQPASSGFANSTFFALHAFRVTNAAGVSTPVRWVLTPEQPFEAGDAAPAGPDKKYLFGGRISPGHPRPVRWAFHVTVRPPGRPPHDPPP